LENFLLVFFRATYENAIFSYFPVFILYLESLIRGLQKGIFTDKGNKLFGIFFGREGGKSGSTSSSEDDFVEHRSKIKAKSLDKNAGHCEGDEPVTTEAIQ
jgi:hypothetical protein